MIKELKSYYNSGGSNNYTVNIIEGENSYSTLRCQLEDIDNSLTTDSYINWSVFQDCVKQPGIWTNQHSYIINDSEPWFTAGCISEDCFTNEKVNYYFNKITGEYTIRKEGDDQDIIQIDILPIAPFDNVVPFLTSSYIDSEYTLGNLSFVVRAYKSPLKYYDKQVSIIVSTREDRGNNCLDPCFFSDLTKVYEVTINIDNPTERTVYCNNITVNETEILQLVDIHFQRVIAKQTESFMLGIDLDKNPYYFSTFTYNDIYYSKPLNIEKAIIQNKEIKFYRKDDEVYVWKEGNLYNDKYILTVDIGIIRNIGDKVTWLETDIPVDYYGGFASSIRVPNNTRVFKFNHVYANKKTIAGLYYTKGNNLLKTDLRPFRDYILEHQEINLEELCFSLLLLLESNYKHQANEFSKNYHQSIRVKQTIETHIDFISEFISTTGSLPKGINAVIHPPDIYDDNKYTIIRNSCFDNRLFKQTDCVSFDDSYIINEDPLCKPACGTGGESTVINTREVSNIAVCYFWLLLINYQEVYKSKKYYTLALAIKSYLDTSFDNAYLLLPEGNNLKFAFKTNIIFLIAYMQWVNNNNYSRGIKYCSIIYNNLKNNMYSLTDKMFRHNSVEQLLWGYIYSIIENRQEQVYSYETYINQKLFYKNAERSLLQSEEYLLEYEGIPIFFTSGSSSKLGPYDLSETESITKKVLSNFLKDSNISKVLSNIKDSSLVNNIDSNNINFLKVNNWRQLYSYELAKLEAEDSFISMTPVGDNYFSTESLKTGQLISLYRSLIEELAIPMVTPSTIKEDREIYDITPFHNENWKDFNKRLLSIISNVGISKPNIIDFISKFNLKAEIKNEPILGFHANNNLFNPHIRDSYIQGDNKYIGQYTIDIYEGPIAPKIFEDIRQRLCVSKVPIINEIIIGKDKSYKEGKILGLAGTSIFVPVVIEPVCCQIKATRSRCSNTGTIYKLTYLEPVKSVYSIYKYKEDYVGLYNPLPGYKVLQVINPLENPEQYIYIKE